MKTASLTTRVLSVAALAAGQAEANFAHVFHGGDR